jgi:hypothetical protein
VNDPFEAYGRDLRRAARRRIRRGRVASAATVVAVVALLAVIVLPALSRDGEPEREVAAPPAAGCAGSEPPQSLTAQYSAFGDAGTDRLPDRLAAHLEQDLPGGSLVQLWADHAHVREFDGGKQFWIVPGVRGSCEKPEPVVCSVLVVPDAEIPGCSKPEQAAESGAAGKTGDGRWYSVAAVPDGAGAKVRVGGRSFSGDVEDNVFLAIYQAADGGSVKLEDGWTAYAPAPSATPGCGRGDPLISDLPTPPALLHSYAILRRGERAELPSLNIPKDVARVFPRGARAIAAPDGRYVVIPVLLWNSGDCEQADATPALCLQDPADKVACDALRPTVRKVEVVPDDDPAPDNVTTP